MQDKTTIQRLKAEYVAYFEDVPIQKFAAMFIGRDEDTVIRWKKEDADFADAVQRAKAIAVRKMMVRVKPEYVLEKLSAEIFGELKKESNMNRPKIYLPRKYPKQWAIDNMVEIKTNSQDTA
jgi:hypothetical protein